MRNSCTKHEGTFDRSHEIGDGFDIVAEIDGQHFRPQLLEDYDDAAQMRLQKLV